jgi:ParB family chromosome partitioning protein
VPPAPKKSTPARTAKLSPDDLDIRQEMERLLQTPVNLARTEKELRVTIFFHTDEKFQEFLDLLNAT